MLTHSLTHSHLPLRNGLAEKPELETYEISRQIFDERILFHVKHSLHHVSNILFHVKQNLHWPSEPHSGTRGASRAALAMRKRRGIRALRHAFGA